MGGMCSLGRRTPTAGLASEWEREIAGGGGESNAGLTPAGRVVVVNRGKRMRMGTCKQIEESSLERQGAKQARGMKTERRDMGERDV